MRESSHSRSPIYRSDAAYCLATGRLLVRHCHTRSLLPPGKADRRRSMDVDAAPPSAALQIHEDLTAAVDKLPALRWVCACVRLCMRVGAGTCRRACTLQHMSSCSIGGRFPRMADPHVATMMHTPLARQSRANHTALAPPRSPGQGPAGGGDAAHGQRAACH